MSRELLIIANWKMYFSHRQTLEFCTQYGQELADAVSKTSHTLVLCPTISALSVTPTLIMHPQITWAGQCCSPYPSGAHTGDISATTLQELGCTHCIVGHSERRTDSRETNMMVANQALQLLHHGIIPIVCIGETEQEHEQGATLACLQAQLSPVLGCLNRQDLLVPYIIIAYEPLWAIGTDKVPVIHDLELVFGFINNMARTIAPELVIKLIYGGNVNEFSVHTFARATHLEGFLIGRASTQISSVSAIIAETAVE
jgi:triosephosphate isomerase (TIM)